MRTEAYNEIEIEFKNGVKDWVSPIQFEDVKITDKAIIINNGHYDYEYFLNEINGYSIYVVVKIDDNIESCDGDGKLDINEDRYNMFEIGKTLNKKTL